jgi:hypothetical protein
MAEQLPPPRAGGERPLIAAIGIDEEPDAARRTWWSLFGCCVVGYDAATVTVVTANRCPLCLTHPDTAHVGGEVPAQCFACGQLFCGECRYVKTQP